MPWPMTLPEEIPAVLSVTGPTYHGTGSMDPIHSPPRSMKKDFKRKKKKPTPKHLPPGGISSTAPALAWLQVPFLAKDVNQGGDFSRLHAWPFTLPIQKTWWKREGEPVPTEVLPHGTEVTVTRQLFAGPRNISNVVPYPACSPGTRCRNSSVGSQTGRATGPLLQPLDLRAVLQVHFRYARKSFFF